MARDWLQNKNFFPALVLGLGLVGYLLYRRLSRRSPAGRQSRPAEAVPVGTVTSLSVFPVKSCRVLNVQEAFCGRSGLRLTDVDGVSDRTWMVVTAEGVHQTLRQEPRLALVEPSFPGSGQHLQLTAPNMPSLNVPTHLTPSKAPAVLVKVWGQEMNALYCGDEAAQWFQTFLKRPGFRLVYAAPSQRRRVRESKILSADQYNKFPEDDEVAFPDISSLVLMTEQSIDDLNTRLSGTTVTERNFRSNILISASQPYEEDTWKDVYIGTAKIFNVRRLDRCTLPTVDPETGIKNPDNEPLETLRTYRKVEPTYGNSPCLGTNATVVEEGVIKVGDVVYATIK